MLNTKGTDLKIWDIQHGKHRKLALLKFSMADDYLTTTHETQTWESEIFFTFDTDQEYWGIPHADTGLKLWYFQHVWQRLETLRYLHIWHRLKTLSFPSWLTQHSRSEIFTRGWHRSWGLRYSTQKTQILRPEILSMADTDPKTWYIQHMRHRSQNLRYSTLKTTLKLWDIQQKDTDLKTWDIQNGRCRYLFWKVKKKLRNCNRITIKTNFKLRKDSVNLNVAFTSIKSLGSIPSFNK